MTWWRLSLVRVGMTLAWSLMLVDVAPASGEELELVAVLEMDSASERVKIPEAQFVTDAVRKAAAETLDRGRYLVMTRENMDLIVPPEERKCIAGMCYAEIGKRLQARYVVGGNIRDIGGMLGVTLEAYESRTGALLGSEQGEAKDILEVVKLVREMAPRLLRRVVVGSGGTGTVVAPPPPPPPVGSAPSRVERVGEIKPEVGFLRVEGSPKGSRVDIAGPRGFGEGGKVSTGLPYGPAEVPAGEYRVEVSSPGYEAESRTVFVPSDRTVAVEVKLIPSEGVLEVSGRPEGARVELSCGKGFTRSFGLPGTLSVPRGTCRVRVSRTGYDSFERTVEVEGGKTAKVEVRLEEVSSPVGGGGVQAGKAGIEWVTIPGGSFMMGSNGGDSDEQPLHRVTVGTFQMARTEVTVAQYRRCVEAGACTEPGTGGYCNWGKPDRDDHPVNCVDWDQARAFSRWVGGRLPTEAEWEYAARSGGLDRVYPWGNEEATCERAVMHDGGNGCGRQSTWPVCSKPSGNTAQGLCDMAGNVWEWVQDWYHDSYRGAPTDGRAWESPAGSFRVFRGGSWFFVAWFVRAAFRDRDVPGVRDGNLGFRPSRSVP